MVLRFFLLASVFFLMSCSSIERDNPNDPNSDKYRGWQVIEPPVGEFSSGSVKPSSSSVAQWVPSSSSLVMPSSSSAIVSSSSSTPVCTAADNDDDYYCSNGTAMKEYGFVTDEDGQDYKTVEIGTQIWMAENLNYEVEGSECYDKKPANCDKYGRLYDWHTAMTACPPDWHLPNNAEWTTLMDFVGGRSTASKYLKATSGWERNGNKSGNGTNAFGFSALPGGGGDSGGNGGGNYGSWWSSSDYNSNAYSWGMDFVTENVGYSYYNKTYLYSVRCVKD